MSKYGNKITHIGKLKFDSRKEGRYYLYLRELEKRGEIENLKLQVPFVLLPKIEDQRAVKYIADFVYDQNGENVVVDVKSEATRKKDAYILKKKMMRALLGIKIVEV